MRGGSVVAIATILSATALSGCGTTSGQSPAPMARHWIVAADLSASRNSSQLRESEAFVDSLPKVAANGDRITLLRVRERGLADSSFQWSHDIPASAHGGAPTASDSTYLDDAKRELVAETSVLFDPEVEGRLLGTDLFATLFRVADLVRSDRTRKSTLVMLSDMLQSTHDLNMERVVPDTTWVTDRAAKHLLPDLTGVCVVALGVDVSTARGERLRQFWRAYFRAAGADYRDANLRNWAPDLTGLGCN